MYQFDLEKININVEFKLRDSSDYKTNKRIDLIGVEGESTAYDLGYNRCQRQAKKQLRTIIKNTMGQLVSEAVELVNSELSKLCKQYGEDMEPTDDEDKVHERIFIISETRWKGFKDAIIMAYKLGNVNVE